MNTVRVVSPKSTNILLISDLRGKCNRPEKCFEIVVVDINSRQFVDEIVAWVTLIERLLTLTKLLKFNFELDFANTQKMAWFYSNICKVSLLAVGLSAVPGPREPVPETVVTRSDPQMPVLNGWYGTVPTPLPIETFTTEKFDQRISRKAASSILSPSPRASATDQCDYCDDRPICRFEESEKRIEQDRYCTGRMSGYFFEFVHDNSLTSQFHGTNRSL